MLPIFNPPSAPGGTTGQVQSNSTGQFAGLTQAALTALILSATSVLSGAVPASGGGTAAVSAAVADEDEAERERTRETRELGIQAAVSIAVAAGIMVLMLWPQLPWAMEELNKVVLWPATFVQFWAGKRFYTSS